MLDRLMELLGVFFWPQLAISVLTVGVVAAYLLAWLRRQITTGGSWRRPLDSLGAIAVSVGLLGSVWAFVQAFGNFNGVIDTDRVVTGLGTAYTTTGVGLVTAIIATIGELTLDALVGEAKP